MIPSSKKLLQTALAIVAILGGLDKYFNLLTFWPKYVPPFLEQLLPFSAQTYMYLVGVVEIAAGLLIIFRPKLGGLALAGMFCVIIAHLIFLPGYNNIILLDAALALCGLALFKSIEA